MPKGGVARRATAIKMERQNAEHVLILDAGNSLLLDKDPAKRTRGQSSIEAMNRLGYNAMTLGATDLAILSPDEIKARIAEAKFPVLSANAYLSGTQELVAQPYVILEMADHHVGILGLSDAGEETKFQVADPIATAKKVLPELQRQADIVIVLSHAGLETDKQLAEQVAGIDVIVSGRSMTLQDPFISPRTGTVIVHADVSTVGTAGERVASGTFLFDETGRLVSQQWRKILLDPSFAEDKAMLEWLRSLVDKG